MNKHHSRQSSSFGVYKLCCNKIIATITHDESIDTPLSITNKNGTFYYHSDHQGSIVALTDQAGTVVESFTYDNHYGIITNHTKGAETNNPYGYIARVVDTSDLYYYIARYYDPELQRFISQDPIGFASGDFNWYRYVGNDPVGLRDPWGLAPDKDKMYICKSSNYWRDTLHAFLCSGGRCAGLYPNLTFFSTGYSGKTEDDTKRFDMYYNDGYCEEIAPTAPTCDENKLRICLNQFTYSPITIDQMRYPYNLFTHNCRSTAAFIALKCEIQSECYQYY